MTSPLIKHLILIATLLGLAAAPLAAQLSQAEYARVEVIDAPTVNLVEAKKDDQLRAQNGRVSHFASSLAVDISPFSGKAQEWWQMLDDDTARLRLRIRSRDALSLSLKIDPFHLPKGGSLSLYPEDLGPAVGPFTEADNEDHGELWTPPMLGDELLLELVVPLEALGELELQVVAIQHGYAGFGATGPTVGDCHVDVACEEAKDWAEEMRSVGLLIVEGVRFCSGFLVNNTREDGRPFFMTARHCGVNRENAASVVVFWNHQAEECRDPGEESAVAGAAGNLRLFQTGAVLRAVVEDSDAVLLELDDSPRPEHNLYYAGWDRTAADPRRATSIHHPNIDAKRISFDGDRSWTTTYLLDEGPGDGSHIRVGGWESGSTEGGSSGAPLFNQDRRVVGQLHGGFASCGNRQADWFGRFSESWDGEGGLGHRLSDWLDPLQKKVWVLDGLDSSVLVTGE